MFEMEVRLTAAVVYWLEYEHLCGRVNLLSEASLKFPIAEFLMSVQDHELVAEVPYPDAMQPQGRGRRRSMDFCLQRPRGANAWTAIYESKWVNGRRDILPEIFDDLYRLQAVKKIGQTEPFARYLLVAGFAGLVREQILDRTIEVAPGSSVVLSRILPEQPLGESVEVDVQTSQAELLSYWSDSAKSFGPDAMTQKIAITFAGSTIGPTFSCHIWRINRVPGRPPLRPPA